MNESNLVQKFIELVQEIASTAATGEIVVRFERGAPISIRKTSDQRFQPEIERRNSS